MSMMILEGLMHKVDFLSLAAILVLLGPVECSSTDPPKCIWSQNVFWESVILKLVIYN